MGFDVATKKPGRKVYGPTGIKHGSEQRRTPHFIRKRLTETEKELIRRLAEHRGVSEADLLAPHVEKLLSEAMQLEPTGRALAATG
ncbi:Uncharacterised protein [Mycobacteroides abscessus subsp. abscessus]|nr:Uncharacterised protein [Mycobacteroides abscessus subsp. abscessus]